MEKKLRVDIIANNKKLDQGLKEAQNRMKSFAQTATKIFATLGAGLGIQQIIRFGTESAKLADTQLQAERKLLVALGNREGAQRRLIAQARELQKVTRFGDEATIEAQALLSILGLTEKQIIKLTPLIQDMSTGLGIDLTTAATLVGKSITTTTDALSRYFGTGLAGVIGQSERAAVLTDALTRKFEGQSTAMADLAMGPVVQLQNAFGDLRETIGDIGLTALSGKFKTLKTNIEDVNTVISFLKEAIGDLDKIQFSGNLDKITNIIAGAVAPQLQSARNLRRELRELLSFVAGGIEKKNELTEKAIPGASRSNLGQMDLGFGQGGISSLNLSPISDSNIADLPEFIKNPPLDKIESLRSGFFDVSEEVKKVNTSLHETSDDWAGYVQPSWDELINMTDIVQGSFVDMGVTIGEALGNVLTSTGSFGESMKQMLFDVAKSIGRVFIAIGTGMALVPGTRARGLALMGQGIALTAIGQVGSNLIAQNQQAEAAKAAQQQQEQELTVAKIDNRYIYLANKRGASAMGQIT